LLRGDAVRIEIGGGLIPLPEGTMNLDPAHGKGKFRRKAEDIPWPVENDSIDEVRASHVMEHIAAGHDRIAVMNEVHRVLKPGGTFEIYVPFIENPVGTMWPAIADPTHISYWCKESFDYFDGMALVNADYGIKLWTTVKLETTFVGWEGHWIGQPVKNGKSAYDAALDRAEYVKDNVTQYVEVRATGEITRSELVKRDAIRRSNARPRGESRVVAVPTGKEHLRVNHPILNAAKEARDE
jgi:SAM-dependent methyltransferase